MGNHALSDKLLWGSDYPMVLDRYDTYREMLEAFISAIDFGKTASSTYQLPRDENPEVPDTRAFIQKLVHDNPVALLFSEK